MPARYAEHLHRLIAAALVATRSIAAIRPSHPGDFWLEHLVVLLALALLIAHYDRIVHAVFGLAVRRPLHELDVGPLAIVEPTARRMVVVEVLGMPALYELLGSWAARIVAPELGTAFLGVQGDPWDAQRDMTCALAGVLVAHAWARGRLILVGQRRPNAAALGDTRASVEELAIGR